MNNIYAFFAFILAFIAAPTTYTLGQASFSDLSPQTTGIDFFNKVEDTPEHNILIYSNYYGGAGVGIGDFDGNGFQDIFFAGNLVADRLYLNQGSMQFSEPEEAGILVDGGWSSGVVVADANHDGWPDIYLTRELYDDAPDLRANLLYINRGDGTFQEVASRCGVADRGRSRHATFFDFDGDGDLDLYVLNQPPNPGNYSPLLGTDLTDPAFRSKLYRNDGNDEQGIPRFTETGPEAGVNEVGFPNSVLAADLDNDGWTDLYVSHDYDAPDRLYHNNTDGTFTNILPEAIGHTSFYGMGVDGTDLNQDGLTDLMVLDMVAEDNYRLKANMSGMNPEAFDHVVRAGGHYQYMFNTLQLNRGRNQFSEIAQLAGIAATDWSWANLFADLDNDGLQDLFITNGLLRDIRNTDAAKEFSTHVSRKINAYIAENPDDAKVTIYDVINLRKALDLIPSQPLANYAYRNVGNLEFSNMASDWGLDKPGFSTGAAYADLDNDGRLELVINNLNAPASIYHNQGATGDFLRVRLLDPAHRSTFGAKVQLSVDGQARHFETTNVRGMYSTSESDVHFGLGSGRRSAGAMSSSAGQRPAPEEGNGAMQIDITWPDGSQQRVSPEDINTLVTITKNTVTPAARRASSAPPSGEKTPLLQELPFTAAQQHRENYFDDYQSQVLLPHRQSQNGPALAVADIDGDGLEDVFLGGASGQAGQLLRQSANASFRETSKDIFRASSLQEDVAALFFDADGDSDQDLYVVSGGNEWEAESPFYQDRLYLNDGQGNFTAAPPGSLPNFTTSGGCVSAADVDGDGDDDLFVGGRLRPQDYPAPASSHLLLNDGNGHFTDASQLLAPMLHKLGLVTDAAWTDLNEDGRPDLLIAGEWMPLTALLNLPDGFRPAHNFTDAPATGWWFSITKADLDGDGDDDFIFGNLGENYKYHASAEEPFELFYEDFDNNGKRDIVLSYYNGGEQFPLRGRSCSAQQIPGLKQTFPSYDAFAGATLQEVFAPDLLNTSLRLTADNFSSMIGYNEGGRLKMVPLPREAQFSPLRSALVMDLNKNGQQDILLHGNLYQSEVETPRADAGIGLVLTGNKDGTFHTLTEKESGLGFRADARAISKIQSRNGELIIIAVNNAAPRLFQKKRK